MRKRGQIFILAALLLGFIIFILVSQTQYVKRSAFEGNFEELNENYERESSKFINELLKDPTSDIAEQFTLFTTSFTAYSKGQNPNFELIYAFDFGGKLYVGNYLSKKINVDTDFTAKYITDLPGCFEKIKGIISSGGFNIGIGQLTYSGIDECSRDILIPGEGKITYPIYIQIGDDTFNYVADVNVGVPELIIVSREERGEERKVFTKGRFLKGEGKGLSSENQ